MEIWHIVVIVVGAVTVPLIIFMFSLRPFVKDTIRADLSDFKTNVEGRLSRMEGRLDEIGKWTQKIPDMLPQTKENPNNRRTELLKRWKQGTLTYQESTELRDILAHEAEQAEENKKAIITLGVIGLLLYALGKKD
ncbi:hypothetical protein M1N57_01520 [Dehalococcoidales bacterium]|nr:hypothetical protein [Dehalococcoidales bacterium]